MTYQISISRQAEDDLRNVFEYIAQDLQSLQNAMSQLDRLEKAILSLNHMPQRYRSYDKGSTSLGTGGMVTKLRAAEICLGCGCEMVIANGKNPDLLYDILDGKQVGTTFREE